MWFFFFHSHPVPPPPSFTVVLGTSLPTAEVKLGQALSENLVLSERAEDLEDAVASANAEVARLRLAMAAVDAQPLAMGRASVGSAPPSPRLAAAPVLQGVTLEALFE